MLLIIGRSHLVASKFLSAYTDQTKGLLTSNWNPFKLTTHLLHAGAGQSSQKYSSSIPGWRPHKRYLDDVEAGVEEAVAEAPAVEGLAENDKQALMDTSDSVPCM